MKRQLRALLFAVITGILLGACGDSSPSGRPAWAPPTPAPTFVNRGLAYGEPCKPPCWERLVPGVSTEDEVRQTLQRLRENGEIYEYSCGGRVCDVAGVPGAPSGWTSIWIEGGIVELIEGAVDFNFDAQQLVELLGPPGAVHVVGGGSCSTCQSTGGHFETPIHILYPDLGAWFLLLVGDARSGCICPDTQVVAFMYFRPMPMDEMLDYLVSLNVTGLSGVHAEDLVEWHGFGPGYSEESQRRPIYLPLGPTEMPRPSLTP
jgi:hypothetical protein